MFLNKGKEIKVLLGVERIRALLNTKTIVKFIKELE
jgi:hypothetical protein